MTMFEGQDILTKAASEGVLSDTDWVKIFPSVLTRLEHNVRHEFVIPKSAPPQSQTIAPTESSTEQNTQAPPQDVNAAGTSEATPQPVQDEQALATQPITTLLPAPLSQSFQYIKDSITTQFEKFPPHTIQRLSELLLYPKQHHRFLHAYLNALDRVVSVYSSLNSFPMPETDPSSQQGANPLSNGVHLSMKSSPAPSTPSSLGSDESLGGALLTPIPWLRESANEGPQSASSPAVIAAGSPTPSPDSDSTSSTASGIPTPESTSTDVTLGRENDGAITQGELLRQEQQSSLPPAPISSLTPALRHTSPEVTGDEPFEEPHARGPEAIGMEDTGPQEHALGTGPQVLDMQAAAGRGPHPSRASPGPAPERVEESQDKTATSKDADGDTVLVDADGLQDGSDAHGSSEETRDTAPAASDSTAQ